MALPSACKVEYFGGPVDGHTEFIAPPLEPFLGVKSVPGIYPAVLAALARLLRGCRPANTIPLAIYELEQRDRTRLCYRYLGTHAVHSKQLRRNGGLSSVMQRVSRTSQKADDLC